jgi:Colicin E5 ribonuclease domain
VKLGSDDSIKPVTWDTDLIGGLGALKGLFGALKGLRQAKALEKSLAAKVAQFEKKIENQLEKRGWSKDSVNDTIKNPHRTVEPKDTRWNADGTRRNDSATAYIREDKHYVVRNNNDSTVVQVSNRNVFDWKSPFE